MPSLARRLARRYVPHRLRRAGLELLGRTPAPRRSVARPKPPAARRAAPQPAAAVTPAAPLDPLVETMRRGGSVAEAVVAETRALLRARRSEVAKSIGVSLQSDPATWELGALVLGIVASAEGYDPLAWSHLRSLPEPLWTRHAPREWVRSGLDQEPEATLARIADLSERAPGYVPAAAWLEMIGPVFGHDHHDLVGRLYSVFDNVIGDGATSDPAIVVQRDWLRPWVSARSDGATAPSVPAASISVAILAYGHPGRWRASANIGDHVQSVASLGHIVRHQGLRYSGRQDLVDLLQQLRSRVRPELQRFEVEVDVELLQVDRDASMYTAIPPQTWALAFGWYMHPIFDIRYGLPFHPNLLPIFVSFHCSNRELLTEEAISYLRRYAPIGCRDWTTVDILLSVDVPAFFSGCLTTTTRTVFPEQVGRPANDAPVAYVDVPEGDVPAGAPTFLHSEDTNRFRSFVTNVYAAVGLLDTYRSDFSGVVTSRLHCYLPVRSLGVPVDFVPKNRSDPRFAGLIDITDAEFDRMQLAHDARLERVLTAIFTGQDPDSVYALWRALTAEEVAAAEARRHADTPLPAAGVDLRAEIRRLLPAIELDAESIPIAVLLPPRGVDAVAVLLSSLAEQSHSPQHVVVVGRDISDDDRHRLVNAAPGHRVDVVDTRGIGIDVRSLDGVANPRDIDLLILPELLPGASRMVVLPTNAILCADVAELGQLDLAGELLAAPTTVGRRSTSGYKVFSTAAERLQRRTAAAAELRRRSYARHRFDFDAFDVDVMVIDLDAWRQQRVLDTYLPYVEEFGLRYRELLHVLVGPHRVVLPERWHAQPGRTSVEEPALLHWRGTKPWADDVAPDQERWFAARERQRRTGG